MLDMPASRTERRRAEVRAELVSAAWELCREHGLTGLTVRLLADRVGMRAPSLYSYFASKEAVYDAMFAEGQRQLLERLDPVVPDATTRKDFQVASRVFFDFCTEDPLRYQLMFQRVVPGFQPSAESYALAVEVLERLDAALAAAGVTDPADRDLWTAIVTGLTDQQISNDPGGDRWARLLPTAVELFCDHVGIE